MFDTVVTIVGNALNTPEWRRLPSTQTTVAKFKVAATSRRYDKERGRWVDGPSLRVRVNCWRRLAENVVASVITGDPVIVTGRIYTRDWVGDDGQHRVSYEMDAVAVGHDLARGRSKFERNRSLNTTMIDDTAAEPGSAANSKSATEPGENSLQAADTALASDTGLDDVGSAGLSEDLSIGGQQDEQLEPAPTRAARLNCG